MAVNSRQTLIDYSLRKLGEPVIKVNVDLDQLEDRVDEALEVFREYNDDALVRIFLKHQVTSTDITNGYIPIPSNVLYVTNILPINSSTGSGMWDVKYQMMLNDLAFMHSYTGISDLAYYEQMNQHLSLLNMTLNGHPIINFSRHQNRLYLHGEFGQDSDGTSGDLVAGDYIVVETKEFIDGNSHNIWDNIWLKKYTTSLIKRQWGANMSKFDGMQLPGGVQINGAQLYTDALTEIEKLEEELRSTYETPIDFFIG